MFKILIHVSQVYKIYFFFIIFCRYISCHLFNLLCLVLTDAKFIFVNEFVLNFMKCESNEICKQFLTLFGLQNLPVCEPRGWCSEIFWVNLKLFVNIASIWYIKYDFLNLLHPIIDLQTYGKLLLTRHLCTKLVLVDFIFVYHRIRHKYKISLTVIGFRAFKLVSS